MTRGTSTKYGFESKEEAIAAVRKDVSGFTWMTREQKEIAVRKAVIKESCGTYSITYANSTEALDLFS